MHLGSIHQVAAPRPAGSARSSNQLFEGEYKRVHRSVAMIQPSGATTAKARPIHAYLLLLAGCMSVLAAVLIAPNLPRMQAHFVQVPRVEFLVPIALTAPALVIALLSLFVGAIADRIGRKRLLVWGLVLYAAFGMAPMWLDSLHVILATRIGVGFTEALIMTCCTALIGDYFEGLQRERYLALNTTFASTSAVIFIAVGGALGEFGWRVPFAVYAISLMLVPAALLLLWEPERKSAAAGPHGLEAGAPAGSELSTARLVLVCAVTVVGAVAFMAVQVHIGYLLEAVGVTSPKTVGLVAAAGQLAVVTGSLLFRLLLRAGLGTSGRLAASFGLIGAGFITVGSAGSFAGVTTGALITGLGGGILCRPCCAGTWASCRPNTARWVPAPGWRPSSSASSLPPSWWSVWPARSAACRMRSGSWAPSCCLARSRCWSRH